MLPNQVPNPGANPNPNPNPNATFIEDNFDFIPVQGDGNCFYYAAALYLAKEPEEIRLQVVNYMKQNRDEFLELFDNDPNALDTYIDNASHDRTYVEFADIRAFTRSSQRPVVVIYPNRHQQLLGTDELLGEPIFLWHNGQYDNNTGHFGALVPRPQVNTAEVLAQLSVAEVDVHFNPPPTVQPDVFNQNLSQNSASVKMPANLVQNNLTPWQTLIQCRNTFQRIYSQHMLGCPKIKQSHLDIFHNTTIEYLKTLSELNKQIKEKNKTIKEENKKTIAENREIIKNNKIKAEEGSGEKNKTKLLKSDLNIWDELNVSKFDFEELHKSIMNYYHVIRVHKKLRNIPDETIMNSDHSQIPDIKDGDYEKKEVDAPTLLPISVPITERRNSVAEQLFAILIPTEHERKKKDFNVKNELFWLALFEVLDFEISSDSLKEIAVALINSEAELYNLNSTERTTSSDKTKSMPAKKSGSPLKKSGSPEANFFNRLRNSKSPKKAKSVDSKSKSDEGPSEISLKIAHAFGSDLIINHNKKSETKAFEGLEAIQKNLFRAFLEQAFLHLRIMQQIIKPDDFKSYSKVVCDILKPVFRLMASVDAGNAAGEHMQILEAIFSALKNFNKYQANIITVELSWRSRCFKILLYDFIEALLLNNRIVSQEEQDRRQLFTSDHLSGIGSQLFYFACHVYLERDRYIQEKGKAKQSQQPMQNVILEQLGKLDAYLDLLSNEIRFFSSHKTPLSDSFVQIYEKWLARVYDYVWKIIRSENFVLMSVLKQDLAKSRFAKCVFKFNACLQWLKSNNYGLYISYFNPFYYERSEKTELQTMATLIWAQNASAIMASVSEHFNSFHALELKINRLKHIFYQRNFFSVIYKVSNQIMAKVDFAQINNEDLRDFITLSLENGICIEAELPGDASQFLRRDEGEKLLYIKENKKELVDLVHSKICSNEYYNHQFAPFYEKPGAVRKQFPSSPSPEQSYDCHIDGRTIVARGPKNLNDLGKLLQVMAMRSIGQDKRLTILCIGMMGKDVFDYRNLVEIINGDQQNTLQIKVEQTPENILRFSFVLNATDYTVNVYNLAVEDNQSLQLSMNSRETLQTILRHSPNPAIHCASGVGRTGMVRMIQVGIQCVDMINSLAETDFQDANLMHDLALLLGYSENFERSVQWRTQILPLLNEFLRAMTNFCSSNITEDETAIMEFVFTRLLSGRRQIRYSVQEQNQMDCAFKETMMYFAKTNLKYAPDALVQLENILTFGFHGAEPRAETRFSLDMSEKDKLAAVPASSTRTKISTRTRPGRMEDNTSRRNSVAQISWGGGFTTAISPSSQPAAPKGRSAFFSDATNPAAVPKAGSTSPDTSSETDSKSKEPKRK